MFNDWTYPRFIELLKELGVPFQTSNMSFSVRDERTGVHMADGYARASGKVGVAVAGSTGRVMKLAGIEQLPIEISPGSRLPGSQGRLR